MKKVIPLGFIITFVLLLGLSGCGTNSTEKERESQPALVDGWQWPKAKMDSHLTAEEKKIAQEAFEDSINDINPILCLGVKDDNYLFLCQGSGTGNSKNELYPYAVNVVEKENGKYVWMVSYPVSLSDITKE